MPKLEKTDKQKELEDKIGEVLGEPDPDKLPFQAKQLARDLAVGYTHSAPKRMDELILENKQELYQDNRIDRLANIIKESVPEGSERQQLESKLKPYKDYHTKAAEKEEEKRNAKPQWRSAAIPESYEVENSAQAQETKWKSAKSQEVDDEKQQNKSSFKQKVKNKIPESLKKEVLSMGDKLSEFKSTAQDAAKSVGASIKQKIDKGRGR